MLAHNMAAVQLLISQDGLGRSGLLRALGIRGRAETFWLRRIFLPIETQMSLVYSLLPSWSIRASSLNAASRKAVWVRDSYSG